MIPKVIHYCWFGGKKYPSKIKKCIKYWKKVCPDYEIKLWNENNFNLNINDYVKEAYKEKKWAFVTDYARLWIVYNEGGIYLDTDVELIKSLNDLRKYESYFGIEATSKKCINTGLGFGAEKNNELVKEMLDQYEDIHFQKKDGTLDITPCPDRNAKIFEKYGYNYKDQILNIGNNIILPCEYLSPKNFETGKIAITKNTVSIHHYLGSWESLMTKIKVFVARLLGYKNK